VGNGVKVVGAEPLWRRDEIAEDRGLEDPAPRAATPAETRHGRPGPGAEAPARQGRLGMIVLAVLAVIGIAGTITFERAWSGLNGQNAAAAGAKQEASVFLVALTNFDAKSVDGDFTKLTSMATGTFATQANQFFNSSIRQQLETALASSRGQIRSLYVQDVSGNQATVYAVVDQLYVNRTLQAPRSDVLRVVVQMSDTQGSWKISDVTVLEGPSLASPSPTSASGG
jgi:hypothetical protein